MSPSVLGRKIREETAHAWCSASTLFHFPMFTCVRGSIRANGLKPWELSIDRPPVASTCHEYPVLGPLAWDGKLAPLPQSRCFRQVVVGRWSSEVRYITRRSSPMTSPEY